MEVVEKLRTKEIAVTLMLWEHTDAGTIAHVEVWPKGDESPIVEDASVEPRRALLLAVLKCVQSTKIEVQ